MVNKLVITPVFIGFILFASGLLMNIFNWQELYGNSILSFGICIIFIILASQSSKGGVNPFVLVLYSIALAAFVAFVILLWQALTQ